MTKRALICGVTGQDGAWLAKLLLEKGYKVAGTSRDVMMGNFDNLETLGLKDNIELVSMSLVDFRNTLQVLTSFKPHEVYNLAGQSSVGLSFSQPVETLESHAMGTLNLLEVIRFMDIGTRLYNASSGECFGDIDVNTAANEETAFRPKSPYAVAKAAAFWEVANYRDAYNIYSCSGILFNHESNLRPKRFVTQKIISAAHQIANGNREKLKLGNLDVRRDWGWAPEYVEAMWLMLQEPDPEDFVIATGKSYLLEEFVQEAFNVFDLNWREHVEIDNSLFRPSEVVHNCGNAAKAEEKLGWKPKFSMPDVVRMMAEKIKSQ